MGNIGVVLTPTMPKQVWQADDGKVFPTQRACEAYESSDKILRLLYDSDKQPLPWSEEVEQAIYELDWSGWDLPDEADKTGMQHVERVIGEEQWKWEADFIIKCLHKEATNQDELLTLWRTMRVVADYFEAAACGVY